jgi:hypothetical protein
MVWAKLRLSPVLLATVAAFAMALGGTSYAATGIVGHPAKKPAHKHKKKPKSKPKPKPTGSTRGSTGPTGSAGPTGPTGATGAPGAQGPSFGQSYVFNGSVVCGTAPTLESVPLAVSSPTALFASLAAQSTDAALAFEVNLEQGGAIVARDIVTALRISQTGKAAAPLTETDISYPLGQFATSVSASGATPYVLQPGRYTIQVVGSLGEACPIGGTTDTVTSAELTLLEAGTTS